MMRILADVSLGLFAATTLAEPIVAQVSDGGVYGWISRFGALGLCAFMVFQNYRQSDALGKVITRQDETIEKHHSEIVGLTLNLATALAQNTRALSDMTAGLHDRPCMAKDRTGE